MSRSLSIPTKASSEIEVNAIKVKFKPALLALLQYM